MFQIIYGQKFFLSPAFVKTEVICINSFLSHEESFQKLVLALGKPDPEPTLFLGRRTSLASPTLRLAREILWKVFYSIINNPEGDHQEDLRQHRHHQVRLRLLVVQESGEWQQGTATAYDNTQWLMHSLPLCHFDISPIYMCFLFV